MTVNEYLNNLLTDMLEFRTEVEKVRFVEERLRHLIDQTEVKVRRYYVQALGSILPVDQKVLVIFDERHLPALQFDFAVVIKIRQRIINEVREFGAITTG